MGSMDEEGFVYFKQRMKRMIVTSGYNVYPSHIENILDKHEAVDCSCVIGVKDPYKMQRVRAYIALKDGFEANDETKNMILSYCKEYLDVFERPKEIIFKDELPKTLVGKVAYHTLEQEAAAEEEAMAK
ncbi:MAG: long-chain fatty acid--CoA ligase, partial [Clostridia bacterium]|nr:long-chain fatty acid--CoA ligase [Clostridia bacterium]